MINATIDNSSTVSNSAFAASIPRYFAELAYLTANVPAQRVTDIVHDILAARTRGSTVFILGNGGSAATASHFACDLIKSGKDPAGRVVRALALTDAVPLLTAIANDDSYDRIFAEQLAIHARPHDLVIALSGSGNSPNVLRCVELARHLGLRTIALTGFGGGQLEQLADAAIVVPASRIQVIEDVHSALCHAIAVAVATAGRDEAASLTQTQSQPAVFCDRDGVLNVRRTGHVKTAAEFEFAASALDALRTLKEVNAPVVVVTNQSIIGRGLAAASDVDHIHKTMQEAVLAAGGPTLAVYVCPHAPENSCDCRKPRPGLLLRAATDLGLDLANSFFIGDSASDAWAAVAAGCRPILLGEPPHDTRAWPAAMIACVPTLTDAVGLVREDPIFQIARGAVGIL